MGGYVGTAKQPIALFDAYTKGQADGLFPDKTSVTPQDFTAMPSVGGDPVVESGSNADGEWTRFADGTLAVFSNIALVVNSDSWLVFPNTNLMYYDLPLIQFPVTFVGNIPAVTTGTSSFVWFRSLGTLSTSQVRLGILRENAASYPDFVYAFSAIGRWK